MTTAAQTQFNRERAAHWKQVQANRDALDRAEAIARAHNLVQAAEVAQQKRTFKDRCYTFLSGVIVIAALAWGVCLFLIPILAFWKERLGW